MWGISYWVFPVISGLTWLGMLIAMLATWCTQGRPYYASYSDDQTIAYISDIGAQGLKPLFITCGTVMAVFLDLSFVSERWLRHKGRLAKNKTGTEKVLTILSFFFAAVGSAGIILLSIFDTLNHPSLHRIFLLLFIAGYLLSAIFICWEYQRLGIHYREHRILRISFWMKLVFILVELVLAIAFAACLYRRLSNAAAILEWAISFIFTFYAVSFFIDLKPAVHTKGNTSKETELSLEQNDLQSQSNAQYNGETGIQGMQMGQVTGGAAGTRHPNRPVTPLRNVANNF